MAQIDLRRQLSVAAIRRREVDHRVKNSLATIGAYTRLKARGADGPVRQALQDVGQRIEAVSLVHGQLYRGDGDGHVALLPYLSGLVDALRDIAPPDVSVALAPGTPEREVTTGAAMAVGSFVNEAVSNAFKHAFGEDCAGTVFVSLAPRDGGLVLTVRDDGAGMEADGEGGLGMAILRAAATDLGAEPSVDSGPGGTSISITF
jgi:two-component sensor histidine kinase